MFKHQAKLIKKIRTRNGLSQTAFADLLGVHGQAVSNMERGLNGFPSGRFNRIKHLVSAKTMMRAASSDFIGSWRANAGV